MRIRFWRMPLKWTGSSGIRRRWLGVRQLFVRHHRFPLRGRVA